MSRRTLLRVCAAIVLVLAMGSPGLAQTDTNVTFHHPALPPFPQPDDDGLLVPTAHAFQEGGMHVEGFWVRNTAPAFDGAGHLHIPFPDGFTFLHGGATQSGLGSDRFGLYVRREDGGPFDLQSLDYRLVQPGATSLLIGTAYDPALPITSQLSAFPVSADASFQTLAPVGFDGVSELFIAWDLGAPGSDRGELDNLRFSIPHGSCSPATPSGVVFAHQGQADPESEGWTAEGASTNVATLPVSDGGVDAWAIDDDGSGAGASRAYVYAPAPDVMCWARTSGVTLRARVRVVDVPDLVDGAVLASYTDGQRLFELRLGTTGLGSPIVSLGGTTATLATLDSGFHTYELIYDPATTTVDLLVDGSEVLLDHPGVQTEITAPLVRFGSLYDAGTGQGNFASVELALPEECANGVDDDGDSFTDHPDDPDCSSPEDAIEASACSDGLDNDGDTAIDYPADIGCSSFLDASETNASPPSGGGGGGFGCGVGPELVLLLPLIHALRRRARRPE